jgi:hypothetical protein
VNSSLVRMLTVAVAAASAAVLACSSSSSPAGAGDSGAPPADASAQADVGADAGVDSGNLAGNDVMGTVGGNSVTVVDAISYDESYVFAAAASDAGPDAGAGVVERSIKLENFSGACALQQMNDSHKANSLYLKLMFGNDQGMPIATGPYPVVPVSSLPSMFAGASAVGAAYVKTNGPTCLPIETDAMSGTITVASVSAAGISGSVTLSFPNGDMLTGTFDAPACDVSKPVGIGTCQQ